jgi:hypothetical protein
MDEIRFLQLTTVCALENMYLKIKSEEGFIQSNHIAINKKHFVNSNVKNSCK